MKKIRITVRHNPDDPADDLRLAAKARRDLWSHSEVEIDPDSPKHGTRRDADRNAYFEFTTNYPDEVQRVLREFEPTRRTTFSILEGEWGPECMNCGKAAGPILPTVCPSCHFRDISPCPHCNQEVARQSYLPVSGDQFTCPMCHRRVQFYLNEPLFDRQGHSAQPLVIVTKSEG